MGVVEAGVGGLASAAGAVGRVAGRGLAFGFVGCDWVAGFRGRAGVDRGVDLVVEPDDDVGDVTGVYDGAGLGDTAVASGSGVAGAGLVGAPGAGSGAGAPP